MSGPGFRRLSGFQLASPALPPWRNGVRPSLDIYRTALDILQSCAIACQQRDSDTREIRQWCVPVVRIRTSVRVALTSLLATLNGPAPTGFVPNELPSEATSAGDGMYVAKLFASVSSSDPSLELKCSLTV